MKGGVVGHNIERGPPKDHPIQIALIGSAVLEEKI
jgi:hypothetical protein